MEDYVESALPHGIDASVVVQASHDWRETVWLCGVAEHSGVVTAVVGWLPLESPAETERLLSGTRPSSLVSVRHLVFLEDDEWLLRPDVLRSLRLVAAAGLVLDLPVTFPRTLSVVPRLADRVPELTLVIDHAGKPPLMASDAASFAAWLHDLEDCAQVSQCYVKLSGLETQFAGRRWSVGDLRPAAETVIDVFGAHRTMWGSDWPVVHLAGNYATVRASLLAVLAATSEPERAAVLGRTARDVYRLRPTVAVGPGPDTATGRTSP